MSSMQYPLINGQYPSWANIEIRVAGKIIGGITEINYNPKLEPGEVRGAGVQPIGYTVGNASYEGDFSCLEPQYYELIALLSEQGPYMTVPFDILVSKAPLGDAGGFATVQDSLIGCRITSSASAGSATSPDGLVKKVTIKPTRVLENGLEPAPATPSADI